jgi:hypothetical protein
MGLYILCCFKYELINCKKGWEGYEFCNDTIVGYNCGFIFYKNKG